MTSDLYLACAMRLVSQAIPDIETAARRLVMASGSHGIDLSLVWGTVEYRSGKHRAFVRQACLAVLGEGRTAMMFVSEPPKAGDAGGAAAGLAERVSCIEAACAYLSESRQRSVRIAQALPEPKETWALEAYARAKFVKVGDLTYMRRAGVGPVIGADEPVTWPTGVEPVSFERLVAQGSEAWAEQVVGAALNRSYEGTLDCPELCGMRETADVVKSHRSTGKFDPRLWWVLMEGAEPRGCLLLNPCPELRSVELVYLGLSATLRGQGLAKRLLGWGLTRACPGRESWDVTCAVDDRNEPARRLYRGMGFKPGARRVALVRPM